MLQQQILDILPAPDPTLAGFVAGPNIPILQAVRELQPGTLLYLWGGRGSGRSHLLRAAAHQPDPQSGQPAGLYVPATQAGERLPSLADEDTPIPAPLIAIDDVQQFEASAQGALFGLINRWRSTIDTPAAFSILCAGNCAPRMLALREDLRTRLAWGHVMRLEQLSDHERGQALLDQARTRGIPLAPELLHWILTHHDRDMGRLMALMDALDRYSLARHRPITLPLLKELLAHSASDP
ncbi:DnaA regulatory inactivator Hda [Castellaniella sp.]|uniref:DnaA regulatory inactivator Hda n=1 Tax=Castellaniella sp. TaxID=1955812 RepID=UPI0035609EAD